ncbi:unnamed protein product, partial [Iphiclides podalirius]
MLWALMGQFSYFLSPLDNCEVRRAYEVFQRCEERVKGKSYTAETCEEEIIDLMESLDHCVADKAFEKTV